MINPPRSDNVFETGKAGTAERDQAEAAIEDVRKRGGIFVEAIRATRMAMALTDPTLPGNPIVFANRSFLDLSGYAMEEVLGQQPYFMNGPGTDPEDAERFRAILEEDRDGVVETVQYAKDGRRFVATVLLSAFKDDAGRTLHHFLSWCDVTRRVDAEANAAALCKAQAALRESETKYRSLFASLDEGFCVIEVLFDAGGKPVDYVFLETNGSFESQTGLADVVGRRMRELVPEHEQNWFDIYGQIALTGEPQRFEQPADALGHWYDVYAFRVGNPEQRHVAILFNDIAERKRAESALRESEARFRAYVTASEDVIYRMSPDWSEMRQLEGQKFLESIDEPSLSWMDRYIDPEDQETVTATINEAIRTKSMFELEHRVRKADGSLGWTSSRAVPLVDERGEIDEWMGAARDVTARRRADEALRESEERLRLIVENARDYAIFTTDPKGCIDQWHAGAEAVFGWSAEEIAGRPIEITFTPEDRERGEPCKELEQAAREGCAPNVRWHVRKDGSRVFIEGNVTALKASDGSLEGFLKIGQDVTERMRAEQHQRTLLAELQHRVRNTLGVVRSIARRTAERSATVDDMSFHFQGRLDAFSRVQAIVTRSPEAGVDLASLIEDELLAHAAREGEALLIEGPDVCLKPRAAESLSLAIHELATNAVKYGALGAQHGRIFIHWDWLQQDGSRMLRLVWEENGVDMPAEEPKRHGFGLELLKRTLPYDLRAETRVDFRPAGLRFEMTMPAGSDVLSAGDHSG